MEDAVQKQNKGWVCVSLDNLQRPHAVGAKDTMIRRDQELTD